MDRLATAPYTREFVKESPVLKKVREQFADLEQSSLRNDIFLGACSHLSSECLKRTHRLLIKHRIHMLCVYGHRRWRRSPRQVSAISYVSRSVFLSRHTSLASERIHSQNFRHTKPLFDPPKRRPWEQATHTPVCPCLPFRCVCTRNQGWIVTESPPMPQQHCQIAVWPLVMENIAK